MKKTECPKCNWYRQFKGIKLASYRFLDDFPVSFRNILHDLNHLLPIRKRAYADHVSYFFALPYFTRNEETLKTFALREGDYFVGTTFDGDRVFQYLIDCLIGYTNNNGIY